MYTYFYWNNWFYLPLHTISFSSYHPLALCVRLPFILQMHIVCATLRPIRILGTDGKGKTMRQPLGTFRKRTFLFLAFSYDQLCPAADERGGRQAHICRAPTDRAARRRTKSTGDTYAHLFGSLLYDINFTVAHKMRHQTFTMRYSTLSFRCEILRPARDKSVSDSICSHSVFLLLAFDSRSCIVVVDGAVDFNDVGSGCWFQKQRNWRPLALLLPDGPVS